MTTVVQLTEYTTWMALKQTAPKLCDAIRALVEKGQTPTQIRANLAQKFNSEFMLDAVYTAACYVQRKRSGGDHGDL